MSPVNILQSLQSALERESEFEGKAVAVQIQHNEKLAKATIARFIEGKWQLFEVYAKPIGFADPVTFGL